MCTIRILVFVLFVKISAAMDRETYRSLVPFRECFTKTHPGLCLKEKALDSLNSTIMSDKPFIVFDMVEIVKNPNYHYNNSEKLSEEPQARSLQLSEMLYKKIEEFFKSRIFKFNMAPAFDEGKQTI